MKLLKTIQFCILGLSLTLPVSSWSAEVLQVKGPKVLIDMKGDEFIAGEEFFIINAGSSKKTAVIKIKQTKNGKAVGEIIKGRANTGDTLQAKASSGGKAMSAEVREERSTSSRLVSKSLRPSWGIQGEYLMSSLNAKFRGGAPVAQDVTVAMKGSSFGVDGYYNYILSENFSLNAVAAYQMFETVGTAPIAACATNTSTSCDVKITYLSFYGIGRWYFMRGTTNLWVGGGGGYLLAMAKKSTVLNESQISSNQVFSFAFGAEYQLSRKNYVPFSFEYHMFPDSASVKANMMVFKGGYGWYF